MLRLASWFVALTVWIAAAACLSPPVETPTVNVKQDTPVRVPQNAQNKVDVLFMIDNSLSMDAMQAELQARFGDFFQVFQDLAAGGTYADLHIGVVTSDYGAGDSTSGNCGASPGGQKGQLQALGATHAASCQAPTGNVNFIEYAFDPNGGTATSNLPSGQDLVTTFTCMASVGSGGCGFEHQLESVYAALKDPNNLSGPNKGFLRSDALLAVVFVTNEDDGSAAPNAKFYENDTKWGAFDTFRQTRYAVECGGNPLQYTDASGNGLPMTYGNCASVPNMGMDTGLAYDISRYTNLFNEPVTRGGVKANPVDVIVFAIDGPETPFQTILADNTTGLGKAPNPSYSTCGPMIGGNCVMRVQHVCQNTVSPAFFADPSVRLNAVVKSVHNNGVTNICGDNPNQAPNYTAALKALGQLISSQISPGCIPACLPDLKAPNCSVQDVTTNPDLTQTFHTIPQCDQAGSGVFPCWKIEPKTQCAMVPKGGGAPPSPQGVGMTIDRNGQPAPDNTTASVECETQALVGASCP